MVYVSLVRDIRFCQNTYLKPRIGLKLLKAVVDFANYGTDTDSSSSDSSDTSAPSVEVMEELLSLLRTALAF